MLRSGGMLYGGLLVFQSLYKFCFGINFHKATDLQSLNRCTNTLLPFLHNLYDNFFTKTDAESKKESNLEGKNYLFTCCHHYRG